MNRNNSRQKVSRKVMLSSAIRLTALFVRAILSLGITFTTPFYKRLHKKAIEIMKWLSKQGARYGI